MCRDRAEMTVRPGQTSRNVAFQQDSVQEDNQEQQDPLTKRYRAEAPDLLSCLVVPIRQLLHRNGVTSRATHLNESERLKIRLMGELE